MLVASLLLPMVIRRAAGTAQQLLGQLRGIVADPDPVKAVGLLGQGLRGAVLAVAPLPLGLLLVGVAAAAAQGGLRPATGLLKPKLSRLNPMAGFKRTFGARSLWETAKAVLKTAVLGLVLYSSIHRLTPALMAPGTMPLEALLATVGGAALTLVRSAAAAGLVMAAADYVVVRRRTNKQLRMTRQEVKEEHKHAEGDPQLRAAIRSRQLAMSRNRMMADLAKADVVVVNPTHVAVALRYDPARGAPRVVAKGAGAVAARIRAVATEHRIPMVQDIPLARALHKACDLGQEIPPDLYTAVAKVLAFVLTLRARGSAAGLHRPPTLLAS
jgi:flagellar biosynthetic protein FlhB